MVTSLSSFLTGTIGLVVILVISIGIVATRPGARHWQLGSVMPVLLIALACHVLHLLEETWTGFHILFPQMLGLAPWPLAMFITFNLVLLFTWLIGLGRSTHHRVYAVLYVFFAIACVVNGFAHPIFSLISGSYFPGLYTSPLVGALGFLLLRRLAKAMQDAQVVVRGSH